MFDIHIFEAHNVFIAILYGNISDDLPLLLWKNRNHECALKLYIYMYCPQIGNYFLTYFKTRSLMKSLPKMI